MKNFQAKTPLVTTIISAVFFLIPAWYRLLSFSNVWERTIALITLLIYAAWMKWESAISVKEISRDYAANDKYTMELAAMAKITTLTMALVFTRSIDFIPAIIGIIFLVSGIVVRTWAIKCLGKNYSHRIRAIKLPVCMDGVFRFVRHPAYLGTFIAHLGFVLVFFNTFSILSLIFLWGGAVLVRTIVEDKYLQNTAQYRSYSRIVPYRLIPWIW